MLTYDRVMQIYTWEDREDGSTDCELEFPLKDHSFAPPHKEQKQTNILVHIYPSIFTYINRNINDTDQMDQI